jgi:hypothetical protein
MERKKERKKDFLYESEGLRLETYRMTFGLNLSGG